MRVAGSEGVWRPKKGRPQPIARTKDSLQKEYPVKVALDTARFPFEVTLSKVTGITKKLRRAQPRQDRDFDLGVKGDLQNEKLGCHLGFFSENPVSGPETPQLAYRRDTLKRNRGQKLPSHTMEARRTYKGRPKDARLKGGPRWILQ